MTPRPRKASDEDVFMAALRVMQREGPAQWTLADIAQEVGLTAGALVQRFGSKHGLQVALMKSWSGSAPALFAGLRAKHRSPLAALRAYGDGLGAMGGSPGAFAHHLAYLQQDLADPALRRELRRYARDARAEVRRLLDEAVTAGELAPATDTAALARAIEVTLNGSLMVWAHHQEGTAQAWIRHDLGIVIKPHLHTQRGAP